MESMTLIFKLVRVKNSIELIEMVESRIPLNFEKALDKSFREFLFGNSHVGSESRTKTPSFIYGIRNSS